MTSPSQGTWHDGCCRSSYKALSSPNGPQCSTSSWGVGWKKACRFPIPAAASHLSNKSTALFRLSIQQLAHIWCHFVTTSKYFKGKREDFWTGLMTETNNWAPQCAVNQTLLQVLGRFSNLPHAASGLRLKSANLLLQKCTKEAPTIIYSDWSLLFQNKYLEPIVTVSDYHTSYVTRHNHQVGSLQSGRRGNLFLL